MDCMKPTRAVEPIARLERVLDEGLRLGGVNLRLTNGLSWQIVATSGMEQYVEKLAHFMGLTPGRGGRTLPRLILTRGAPEEDAGGPFLPLLPDEARHEGGTWRHTDVGLLRHYSHDQIPHVICELKYGSRAQRVLEPLAHLLFPIYAQALEAGGTPLHAALVEKDGLGVVLAGKSGAGKSTCCRRIVAPWRARCDDLTLVLPSQEGHHVVHPLPTWSTCIWEGVDATWETERAVPLAAIFFLEWGDADEASAVGQAEAAAKLAYSASRIVKPALNGFERDARMLKERELIDSACRIAAAVPAYRLRAAREGRFWEEMERAVTPQ